MTEIFSKYLIHPIALVLMMLAIAVLFVLIGFHIGSHADLGLTSRSTQKTMRNSGARAAFQP